MEEGPYADTEEKRMILRDHLAIDRTAMANERTLLAYIRTALAVLVVGASLIRFFRAEIYEVLGWALIPVGTAVLIYGVLRYRHVAGLIHATRKARAAAEKDAQ